jgi:hypothetical protein
MHSVSYSVDFGDILLAHSGQIFGQLLHDGDDRPDESRQYTQVDALAASGDYFMVLATRLDALSQDMPPDSAQHIEIEHMIQTLFYLQKHYSIIPNYKRRSI